MAGLRTRALHGVVFWTRWPHPFVEPGPLGDLLRDLVDNPIVNLTVTGRGGGPLEPGVPATREVLKRLEDLIAALNGQPWRVRWRFDPVLPGDRTLDDFAHILDHMSAVGVETCTFSFPAYRSLKGDLTPQFEAAEIPRFSRDEKAELAWAMGEAASRKGVRLLSCNQPENTGFHPNIFPAACIPADVLTRGHPEGIALPDSRDRSQRTHCNCAQSEDIGDYATDRCGGGCAYCYSAAGGPSVVS